MTANFDLVAPQEGTTSNRYTILGRLTGGGMADIYLAKATSIAGFERHVVLKRVLAEHGRNPQFAKMFLDEARLAAQLQHPNIAQVHDVGIIAGSYFFTMEYVHGKDVRALLQRLSSEQRVLPLNLVLHIVSGALAALQHAHERTNAAGLPLGIVHRDVSPSNVMVSYEGAVKLLDFGVAKATQNAEETLSGTIKGKIAYLSPEQCRVGPIDRRSDIYSVGIVLHEMLTCRRLYRHESDFETMTQIVNAATPPPSEYRTEVSPRLDEIVLKAMEKDPAKRFASAAEMLEAIEAVAATERHQLSAAAMGRFLRELFGDRKEPWKELPEGEGLTPMTITGDPVASLQTPNPAERALAEQLDRVNTLPHESKTVSELPPLRAIPSLRVPAKPSQRTRTIAILVGGAALAIGLVIAVAVAAGSGGTKDLGSEKPLDPTYSLAPAPATEDAAVLAPTLDAPAVVDPAPERTPAPVRTLETTIAAGDWVGAVQLCFALATPTSDQRKSCAIAACSAKQRGVALDYDSAVPTSMRPEIERACRVAGITLRQPAVRRRQDPCELDPLQCQK